MITRKECENRIIAKMEEIVEILHQYNPECEYLALTYMANLGISCKNEVISGFNDVFKADSKDKDKPIDFMKKV